MRLKKILLIVLISLLVLTSTFAILTKTGVIPNYLGIEILCPSNNPSEEDYTNPNRIDPTLWEPLRKPVIYLYPVKEQNVSVSIDYSGKIFVTYPEYDNGWEVIAKPNGNLINTKDGKEYSYLFWEGGETISSKYDMSVGYIVKGSDTSNFLQSKLEEIGLLPHEYNEFIVYWLPQMIENEYNLIHFATLDEYANKVRLNISPSPDSVLRVFMVFKSIDEYIEVEPQVLPSFERNGFTVIEWGGSEIK